MTNRSFPSGQHSDEFMDIYFEIPLWCRILCSIYVLVVIVTGLPGNALVILVQWKAKQKSSTDLFVLSLAICDLISIVVNLTVYLLSFTKLWGYIGTTVWCKVHAFIHFHTYVASALYFALIGTDRYFKICRPHKVMFTLRNAKYASIGVAAVSAPINIHHYVISDVNNKGLCVFDLKTTVGLQNAHVLGCLVLILVTSNISIAYLLIYRRLCERRRNKLERLGQYKLCILSSKCESNHLDLPKGRYKRTNNIRKAARGLADVNTVVEKTDKEEPHGTTATTNLESSNVERNSKRKWANLRSTSAPVEEVELFTVKTETLNSNYKTSLLRSASVVVTGTSKKDKLPVRSMLSRTQSDSVLCDVARQTKPRCLSITSVSDINYLPDERTIPYVRNQDIHAVRMTPKTYLPNATSISSRKTFKLISKNKKNCENKTDQRMVMTTNTMAVASLLYVICTIVPSMASAVWSSVDQVKTEAGNIAFLLLRLMYCINLCANPYFYMLLSSKFRKRALKIIRRLLKGRGAQSSERPRSK